ncbi:MAG TPA: hypothetical protein DCQ06_13695 [Myxococcales bacterium]|nr:hypothetical protein [Myxococcales bacterium]HAN32643.1 hypothetical protein [Myxococcales bacterium]
MARPVDHAQHEEITQKAFDVICRGDLHGLNMARLAAKLEIKRSTLYWYFGNLGELFDAVIERLIEDQRPALRAARDQHLHPVDQLIQWMLAIEQYHRDNPRLMPNLVRLWAAAHPDESQGNLAGSLTRYQDQIEPLVMVLDAGQRQGLIHRCDSRGIVELCVALVDGALFRWISTGQRPDSLLDSLVSQVLEPLRVGARPRSEQTQRNVAGSTKSAVHSPQSAGDEWLELD